MTERLHYLVFSIPADYPRTLCGRKSPDISISTSPVYECGEHQYIGRGLGKSPAPIVVRVTLDENDEKIVDVEILEHYETDGLIRVEQALTRMPAAMVESGSPDVDIVTNATRTGAGLIAAVYNAMAQAAR